MIVTDAQGPHELSQALAMNNAAEPAVNALDEAAFAEIAAMGRLRVVREADEVIALIVLVPNGQPYESMNYRWFCARYPSFLYVDRVVVGPNARGRGCGRSLYEDALAIAREMGRERICCEVNVVPPNPESMAFHAALDFTPIEERLNPESGKSVLMMTRALGKKPSPNGE